MAKKGLKFSKEQLEKLYHEQNLSLVQIGKKFDCESTNILYWLKKFGIVRRPAYRKKIHIPKEVLEDLYRNKKLCSSEIAKKFGIKQGRTVLKKLKKEGIKTKSLSEANTKKFKIPFTGSLAEKAFFLGLRAGDFYVKKVRLCYRLQTSSTHKAQIRLCRDAFKNYGETKGKKNFKVKKGVISYKHNNLEVEMV